jgi:hypothetical protein
MAVRAGERFHRPGMPGWQFVLCRSQSRAKAGTGNAFIKRAMESPTFLHVFVMMFKLVVGQERKEGAELSDNV